MRLVKNIDEQHRFCDGIGISCLHGYEKILWLLMQSIEKI